MFVGRKKIMAASSAMAPFLDAEGKLRDAMGYAGEISGISMREIYPDVPSNRHISQGPREPSAWSIIGFTSFGVVDLIMLPSQEQILGLYNNAISMIMDPSGAECVFLDFVSIVNDLMRQEKDRQEAAEKESGEPENPETPKGQLTLFPPSDKAPFPDK